MKYGKIPKLEMPEPNKYGNFPTPTTAIPAKPSGKIGPNKTHGKAYKSGRKVGTKIN